MDETFWLNVVMRWVHVASAVVGVGATLFMRFVIVPALARVPNGGEVLDAIHPGLKRLVHGALGMLFLSGFYNYLAVAVPRIRELKDQASPAVERLAMYHPVMGFKIILSMVLFLIATLLLMRIPSFHENRRKWLTVNSLIGLLILFLAAYLRRLW